MSKSVTILHLSDLQFGVHHRFTGCTQDQHADAQINSKSRYGSNDAYNTLAAKLLRDLSILNEQENLYPNVLVISGDLAEWSVESEYDAVSQLINALLQSKDTDITPDRLVLVPGNHDVNWELCEAHFLECSAHRKAPTPPYPYKFKFWWDFIEKMGLGRQSETERPWQGYDLREYGIVVVGLNSCIQESHRPGDHYGWLGTKQVEEAVKWLSETDPYHLAAHIAVLHHNVWRGSDNDEENLKDWDDVYPLFLKAVDIILHGHKHETFRGQLGALGSKILAILGTGSAGLDQETIPDVPNQYQILRIADGRGEVFARRYSERTFSHTGRGSFTADADEKGKWKYSFALQEVNQSDVVPSDVLSKPKADDETLKEYLAFTKGEIEHRLKKEQEKVGGLIGLNCRSIREGSVQPIFDLLSHWQVSDTSQLVLLGGAGMGKTISCLQFCERCLSESDSEWLPVYLDLGQYAETDDALEIVEQSFRAAGTTVTREQVVHLLASHKFLFCLDSFDEYEAGGVATASYRSYRGFQHLAAPNIKVLVSCRTNFFRQPEDVFIYELPTRTFELCPPSAVVVELTQLEPAIVRRHLAGYLEGDIPEWLLQLADRPLYLRMLVPLIRARSLQKSQSLQRHQLYDKYTQYVIDWDLRRSAIGLTERQSRDVHTVLAERFLDKGIGSLAFIELFDVLEKVLNYGREDKRFASILWFFQQSGLLRFESGRIVFAHKSYREYMVAKKIFDLITLGDDSFAMVWFTRDERDFITEMLSVQEKQTLCRWLQNESKYAACNYASFILGGTCDIEMVSELRARFDATNDPLVKVNCANALAALGECTMKSTLLGIVTGYLLVEHLATVKPPVAEQEAIDWVPALTQNFGKNVMLIHLCESIDALGMCGDESSVNLLKILTEAPDKSVADEAKGALNRLLMRLGKPTVGKARRARPNQDTLKGERE